MTPTLESFLHTLTAQLEARGLNIELEIGVGFSIKADGVYIALCTEGDPVNKVYVGYSRSSTHYASQDSDFNWDEVSEAVKRFIRAARDRDARERESVQKLAANAKVLAKLKEDFNFKSSIVPAIFDKVSYSEGGICIFVQNLNEEQARKVLKTLKEVGVDLNGS